MNPPMDLRDWFASQMPVNLAEQYQTSLLITLFKDYPKGSWKNNALEWAVWEAKCAAKLSYIYADAMLAARGEPSDSEALKELEFKWQRLAQSYEKLLSEKHDLVTVLEQAVEIYGKFSGLVNDPNSPGEWIAQAKKVLGEVNGSAR